jgi:TPR repeat protein
MMAAEENNAIDALLLAAIDAYEAGDSESLMFTILRAGQIGAENPGSILGTSLIHLQNVSNAIGGRVVELLKRESQNDQSALASYALASIFNSGSLGVERNDEVALEYLKEAFFYGMVESSIFIGVFIDQGVGCKASSEEATHWFQIAAEHGFFFAQTQLVRRRKKLSKIARLIKLCEISIRAFMVAIKDPKDKRLIMLNSKSTIFS